MTETDEKTEEQTGHLMMFVGQSPIPDRDRLVYDPTKESVRHGDTFSLDDDQYKALVSDPYIAPMIKEVDTDYSEMSRAELEEKAREAGIENPDDLEVYPHEGSLAAAIEAAGEEPNEVEHVSAEDQAVPAPPGSPQADEPDATLPGDEAGEVPPTPEEGDE